MEVQEENACRDDILGVNFPHLVDANRCDDNPSAQSPFPIFFVFGRPLFYGGSSGLGGSFGFDVGNMEPLRVVATDGSEWGMEPGVSEWGMEHGVSEWGLEPSVALGEAEEGLGGDDHRVEEGYSMISKGSEFESWEDSCLVKFNEFLGFPTMGFENEILDLMRKLVATQRQEKGKDNTTISRCQRELRKLECSINYNGKEKM